MSLVEGLQASRFSAEPICVSSICCFLAFLLVSIPVLAQEAKWSRSKNGALTIYTHEDPERAAGLIQSFENLRNALGQASPFQVANDVPLKIIVFHSEKDFEPYRFNQGSCAFYQRTGRGEYVVLQDLEALHRDVAAHEFTHFVIAHSGMNLPLWLNEGLADFYSTLYLNGDRIVFGRPVTGRLGVLRSERWLPLDSLFDASTTSPYYSNPVNMALFYSESWALAHMLVASPNYASRCVEFFRTLSLGGTALQAFSNVYNKTVLQVEKDLRDYVAQQHLPTIDARMTSPIDFKPEAAFTVVPSSEVEIVLSDLVIANPNTQASLEAKLKRAAGEKDAGADAEETLGYRALRQGKLAEAKVHFQAAVDRKSTDANVFFYLAHITHEAGAPSQQVTPLLQQALTLDPDLADARLELAFIFTADAKFSEALAVLKQLTKPRPESAYAAAYTEAFCYAHLERYKEARVAARSAERMAASDRDRSETAELIRFIEEQAQDLVASSQP